MSKAFTRESDMPEPPVASRRAMLRRGARNFITIEGAERLRQELRHIENTVRPALVARGFEDPELRLERRRVDQRTGELRESLASATIIDPAEGPDDRAGFGATVTVRSADGGESSYRIVGIDEADAGTHHISWVSPMGKALLHSKVGETVAVQTPSGPLVLSITKIVHR